MSAWRLPARRLAAATLAVALALAACASPTPPVSTEASDAAFTLALSAPGGSLRSSNALDIRATLDYRGPGFSLTVTAPDTGLVGIWFEQLDGPLRMSANSRLMCSGPYTLTKDVPTVFEPVGGHKPPGDDQHLPVYQRWQADPQIHLPAGQWRITARAEVYEHATCGSDPPDHELTTSVTLSVSA